MPHDNAQEFVSIINRMKTWGTAHVVNKRIYIEYSQRLKTLKSLQEISALLSEMLSLNVFPNTVIINQLINKMNQLKQINSAMELHRIAAERHIADAITYASTITAIAKSAIPDVTRALSLFDEAKRLGFADAITYNSTITAIAKSAAPDKSLETLAFSLLEEATQSFHRPDMKHGDLIDLHDLSYGEVYFGLKRRLNTELKNTSSSIINLQIIYGRGLHSHTNFATSIHPLKEAVIRIIRELSAQGVSGTENQDNAGRFNLMINPSVHSAPHQLSELRLNSLFPGGKKTSLNPNANVFVPGHFSGKGK